MTPPDSPTPQPQSVFNGSGSGGDGALHDSAGTQATAASSTTAMSTSTTCNNNDDQQARLADVETGGIGRGTDTHNGGGGSSSKEPTVAEDGTNNKPSASSDFRAQQRPAGGRPVRRVSWQGSVPSSRASATGSIPSSTGGSERRNSATGSAGSGGGRSSLGRGSASGSGSGGRQRRGSGLWRRMSDRASERSFGDSESGTGSRRGSQTSRRDSNTGSWKSRQKRRRSSISSSGMFSWTGMAKKDDMWDDFEGSDYYEVDLKEEASFLIADAWKTTKRTLLTAITSPKIMIYTLLTLAVLLTAGLLTIHKLADAYEAQLQSEAVDTAEEMGMWISRQLDEALLPLFTMSQFVQHLDTFKDLPYLIGPRLADGSAPPLLGKAESHRNVTNICDDPDSLSVFDEIASSVKKDAGMEGILVNIQLAPHAVVCMLHPLVNTEDFPEGTVMDNTGAVGHDLLNDKNRVGIARATIPADGVVIAGPLTLVQGGTPIVQEAIIARLAINMPGYTISLDGVDYDCWGFAVILLNWAALKEKSGIDAMFRREGLEYLLTRTDEKKDKETGNFYYEVKTIAQSENSDVLNEGNSVSIDLPTTNNLWVMNVGYPDGFAAPWLKGLTALVVILSVGISILLMTVLVAKKEMKTLLYSMMPSKIVKKLRRGETVVQRYDLATIFFSDIVGFTNLSASMSPIDVMDMLNSMYTEFDRLVKKHDAYKVETIGDAYIVIGGGPDECLGREGAEKVALFALDAMKFCEDFQAKNGAQVRIRAGLASGPVVAGVVGQTMPKFTLFGDTVNLASRMESTSSKMRIQCSDMTYRLLTDAQGQTFDLEKRRSGDDVGIHVKGKGHTITWWINGASPRASDHSPPEYNDESHLDFDDKDNAELDRYCNEAMQSKEESLDPPTPHRKSITFEDEMEEKIMVGKNVGGNDDGDESVDSVDSDGQKITPNMEKARENSV